MRPGVSWRQPPVTEEHVIENGTELDTLSKGDRISTASSLRSVPAPAYADRLTVSSRDRGPSSRNSSVRHRRSITDPFAETHRYENWMGSSDTVKFAVKRGA